jgi:hypothetical protein
MARTKKIRIRVHEREPLDMQRLTKTLAAQARRAQRKQVQAAQEAGEGQP